MEHELVVSRRNRGRSPIKGLRITSGTEARCTCRAWSWSTNECAPSNGGRKQAQAAFRLHLDKIAGTES